MDERIYLNFIAPSVVFRQYFDENKKVRLIESIAPGVVFMRTEERGNVYQYYVGEDSYIVGNPMYYDSANSIMKGRNFAVKGGLSLDYCFTPNWSAGLTGSFTWAKIKTVQYKTIGREVSGPLSEALNFSHFDYGVTVRYHF
jgi:hypothetical protein